MSSGPPRQMFEGAWGISRGETLKRVVWTGIRLLTPSERANPDIGIAEPPSQKSSNIDSEKPSIAETMGCSIQCSIRLCP